MSKCLRTLRCALLTVTLLFLSSAPIRAQQIQLEVANAVVTKNLIGEAAISITLSPESGRAFAAFSKDVAGRFIEIRSADDVLARLRLQTSIEGGTFQFFVLNRDVTEVARKLSENAARLEITVVAPQQANAQATAPEVGSVFRDCPECPEMVVIPAGKFMMGSSPEEAARDVAAAPSSDTSTAKKFVLPEQPQHEVTINAPFVMAKYPITKGEFATFVQETGYTLAPGCILYSLQYHVSPRADWKLPGFVQTDRDPVVCVSWQDAKAYVGWVNKKVAKSADSTLEGPYRLPSEAEWEYAARAGTRTARWWGDSIGRNNTVCARCGSKWDQAQTAPVGSFHPNPFGLYDVLGNVWQLTEDCWDQSYIGAPDEGFPRLTGSCNYRVGRGGCWSSFPWLLRSATRTGFGSEDRHDYVGFRVAKTLSPTP